MQPSLLILLSLSLNRCLLDANLVYADVSYLSGLHFGCVSKNGHQIKHILAAASTLWGSQSQPPEESSSAFSTPLNAYLNHYASKTKVDKKLLCLTLYDGQKEATKALSKMCANGNGSQWQRPF